MSNLTKNQLIDLALECVNILQKILNGQIQPYDDELHKWAIEQLMRIDWFDPNPLIQTILQCLISIDSCENAPWDTPMEAFEELLNELKYYLKFYIMESPETK
jgi:hypothetical protein